MKTAFRNATALLRLVRDPSDAAGSFLRGASGSLAIRVTEAGLLFSVQVVLARLMGVQSFGVYVVAYAWMHTLLLLGRQGFDTATVRYVAAYNDRENWAALKGFLRFSRIVVLAASLAVGAAFAFGATLFGAAQGDEALTAFRLAAVALPVFAMMQLSDSTIRGLGHILRPQFFVALLHPAFILAGFPAAVLLFGAAPDARTGMAVYLGATTAALLGLLLSLRLRVPAGLAAAKPGFAAREWMAASGAMMFLMSFGTILNQSSIILLGALDGPSAAGQYGAAVRISHILAPLVAAQAIAIGPMISAMHARGDLAELQRVVRLGVRLVFVAAFVIAAGLALFGQPILRLLGEDYLPAYAPLLVLLSGQLLFVAAGPAGLLLNMTGHHVRSAWLLALCALVNIGLAVALIPTLGPMGAAVATAATMTLWGGLMAWEVRRRLGIVSLVTLRLRGGARPAAARG